jgi:hypothetical protein
MNVTKYIRHHEQYMQQVLAGQKGTARLDITQAFHNRQIGFLQHERLVHLLVTLAVALLFMLALIFTLLSGSLFALAFAGGLLGLTGFYLIHYFRLENAVQRWYRISYQLDQRQARVTGNDKEK